MGVERSIAVVTFVALLCGAALPLSSAAVNSVVTQWLTLAQNTAIVAGLEHQQVCRLFATVATAQYDVILLARAHKAANIPEEAAVAYASHAVLSSIFNWRQTQLYDVVLARDMAKYNVSDSLLPTLQALTTPAVHKILFDRLRDNSTSFANFRPFSNSSENIGRYQFVPGQTTSRLPQVAWSKPVWLTSKEVDILTASFKPFPINSTEYAQQLEQVYLYGSSNSTVRSAYDTNSPRFWLLGANGTIAGIWLNISIAAIPESTPLVQQARFFKILGTSLWDAAVACWRVKYRELFWRPITAIRTYHGLPYYNPTWTPLLQTPQFPEYPSGHMCSTGVGLYVLEAFLGNNTAINVTSYGALDISPRAYPSFRAAAVEVRDSRMYAGAHLNVSNVDGMRLGYNVARYIHQRRFKSVTFSSPI